MSDQGVRFLLAEHCSSQDIRQCLSRIRISRIVAPVVMKRRVMDSFDWRLFRKGGVIEEIHQGSRTGTGWREIERDKLTKPLLPGAAPRFASEYPAGPLRQYMLSVLGVRALVPVVDIESHLHEIHALNEDDKTIVRIFLEHHLAGRPRTDVASFANCLLIEPIRGYRDEFRHIKRHLKRHLNLRVPARPVIWQALDVIGRAPMDYSSKLDIPLDGEIPAYVAVGRVLRQLFDTMEANEHGLINDIDPEFLHDFRVAIRRIRCVLRQLRHVLPSQATGCFLNEFGWLGRMTGTARDLDVYLLQFPDYEALLSARLCEGLLPLRRLLEQRAVREKRQLAEYLNSERYRSLKREGRRFLEQLAMGEPLALEAEKPIRCIADVRIEKMLRRVLKEGKAIDRHSPPEALHKLRKSCKKLRYLMELFRHLYPKEEMRRLIGALKRLQDNLGELQDLAVQASTLRTLSEELTTMGDAEETSRQAMETLVQYLQRRHDAVCADFAVQFRMFVSPKNRHRFKQMLAR
ncbi:MAG TPA: CHAD domain-containing protein [Mariprofundaceae bacterium]|nr:CHAD domain-containing protein [Mariprofundaceae bacterium]